MRLDEEKLEALRVWGEGLRQAKGEELAATGRAILMLVEEIDQLHIELWHARLEPSAATTAEKRTAEEPIASSLHSRLQRVLRRGSSSAAPASRLEGSDTDRTRPPQP